MNLPAIRCSPVAFVAIALSVAAATVPPSAGASDGAGPSTTLPGATQPSAELTRQLHAAWAKRPAGYEPRTKHREANGAPKFTNRLFLTASPYLLQHAHNPVNWYPWGDEAFATAKRLGRPVLLSVGYSTCHWCHVMEEESFEDEEIARYLNKHYIAIKVDREERPDVDAIYMSAVRTLTGRAGWPMTVWLTPDRTPFFGGTYFPARDGDRGTRTGFLTLLRQTNEVYRENPEQVGRRAAALADRIRAQLAQVPHGDPLPGEAVLADAYARTVRGFDAIHGGVRGSPKFPSSLATRFLLRYHRRTGEREALDMVTRSLEKMAAGGMYDAVGGGFHRYSTDAQWLVPHFEKMLYDNALLTVAYLEAHQATGRQDFARVARDILRYVEREMTAPDGGFYSATDADSLTPAGHREEGYFFTWTPAEIDAALDPEQARAVKAFFAVTDAGNFEGRNILHTPRSIDAVAADLGIEPAALQRTVDAARDRLYVVRAQRPAPLRDEKILAAWNGLMVSAFARAALVLDEPSFAATANRAATFVLARMRENGRLRRSFMHGRAHHTAYLDDYAFLIAGLLDLFEANHDPAWLREAIALDRVLARDYEDAEHGGFFLVSTDHEALLAREKPVYDGAEPSGNSVQALNLLRLYEWTTDESYRERADHTLRAFAGDFKRAPNALSEMLLALDFRLDTPKEIALISPGATTAAAPFLDVLRRTFLPNRVLVVAREGSATNDRFELVPWLQGKVARGGGVTAYVCERGVCDLPTRDPKDFVAQLVNSSDGFESRSEVQADHP